MVILKPQNTIHQIKIIPRKNVGILSVLIKNEGKNTTETLQNISATYLNGYLTFEIQKTVLEGESFEYSIYSYTPLTADTTRFKADTTFLRADMVAYYSDSNLVFRGKAFATNQTDLQNYKIN